MKPPPSSDNVTLCDSAHDASAQLVRDRTEHWRLQSESLILPERHENGIPVHAVLSAFPVDHNDPVLLRQWSRYAKLDELLHIVQSIDVVDDYFNIPGRCVNTQVDGFWEIDETHVLELPDS